MSAPSDRVLISDLPAGTSEASARDIFAAYGGVKTCRMLPTGDAVVIQFESLEEAQWIVENLNGNIAQGLATPIKCKFAGGGVKADFGKSGPAWTPGGKAACGCAGRWEPYFKGGKGPASASGKGGSIKVLKKGLQYAGVLPGGKWSNDQNALYVNGLPADTTVADLYDIFAPFGAIPSEGVYPMMQDDGTCKGIAFINYLDPASAANAMRTLNGTMMPDGSMLKVQPKGPSKKQGK
mmetsp:Transcript_36047/g.103674  ORF Transcript_36047/g.103674 Transcript_36047/m.103674 type:complete len:237 (-) Transcript_36047:150-860(-)